MYLLWNSIFGVLLAAFSLLSAVNAYSDYNEYDTRSIGEGLGYSNLGARDTVNIPFQHSLRDFLEEAVSAHRRALDYDLLERRSDVSISLTWKPKFDKLKSAQVTLPITSTVGELKKEFLRAIGSSASLFGYKFKYEDTKSYMDGVKLQDIPVTSHSKGAFVL
ncbi:hypothetical protein DFP72DRAFT_1143874 [Ephemerocybe angulata]|uniref:Secreted protein n=1 Tax=Ephemerocybe angulata TaxID=980116 RepID=A0A8H6HLR3_9AGAR|nr:hypothetical protein DFP72DRAFT_1143874 [Tulosesus angulatus]